MTYRGTFRPNRRPVVTTAPDSLVYLNGEASLPSGVSPYRSVDLQPLITSWTTSGSVSSPPGTAEISLHIPRHYLQDFFQGGRLIITRMMEVWIYAKGQYLINGVPQYYPVFWGITTSINYSYSGGEATVSISCQDILYWWSMQHINTNPSLLAVQRNKSRNFNLDGNVFTGMSPFQIMYHLSRQVHGDSINADPYLGKRFQVESELNRNEQLRLAAYWTKRWGKIATALRMFGPSGRLLQGDLLADVLQRSYVSAGKGGKRGRGGVHEQAKFKSPLYDLFQGDIDLSRVTPFSRSLPNVGGSINAYQSELQTKLQVAQQVAEVIGYEFYMDVTGEIIFKPPFYNMDVYTNYPVSWLEDIDIISISESTNIPDATYVEATGEYLQNLEAGMAAEAQPRAKYIDYRLVQQFGYKPAAFNSQYIGSFEDARTGKKAGGPKALFYHCVDQLDRINVNTDTASVTIPLRTELRLGYPVYIPFLDAYYYIESISHSFSYGGQCTTSLTLNARRKRFYGAFNWSSNKEPGAGATADPDLVVQNLYQRPQDPQTGNPMGDRNVLLVLDERKKQRTQDTPKGQDNGAEETQVAEIFADAISMRSSFSPVTGGEYVYQIDPARDRPGQTTEFIKTLPVSGDGRVVDITAVKRAGEKGRTYDSIVFPVSDERGFEVFGGYRYGRGVQIAVSGLTFQENVGDATRAAKAFTFMIPFSSGQDPEQPNPNLTVTPSPLIHGAQQDAKSNYNLLLSPTNYGTRLADLRPQDTEDDFVGFARNYRGPQSHEKARRDQNRARQPKKRDAVTGTNRNARVSALNERGRVRVFKYSRNVDRWRDNIQRLRREEGLSTNDVDDATILSLIHIESDGYSNKRSPSGKYVGLMQSYQGNFEFAERVKRRGAPSLGDDVSVLYGNGDAAIRTNMRVLRHYRRQIAGDPVRAAILWKGGSGNLRKYNKAKRAGLSDEEIFSTTLRRYPGIKGYVGMFRAVYEGIWAGKPTSEEAAALSANQTSEPPNVEEGVGTFVTEDLISFTETETRQRVNSFAEKLRVLQENQQLGPLPSNLQAPRDPSVLPVINDYLLQLYAQLHEQTRAREQELRGMNRMRVVPDVRMISPTQLQQDPLNVNRAQQAANAAQGLRSLTRGAGQTISGEIADIRTALGDEEG